MDDFFNHILDGGIFGTRPVPPKDDHILPFEVRVSNRIRVNNYIIHHLGRRG